MKTFNLLLFTLFFLLSLQSILACTCTDYGVPSCKRFADADAVFVGKIERITSGMSEKNVSVSSESVGSISWDGLGFVAVHFKVEKQFKGLDSKTVKAFTYKGTSCDLEVKKGQRWVIFAVKDEESGNLTFGACAGNYRIKDKDDEPTNLEEISAGEDAPSIVGRVATESFGDGIKDLQVRLEGKGLNLSTTTDKNGWYEFIVPEYGKYNVKVSVPYGASLLRYSGQRDVEESPTEDETIFSYEAEVLPKKCDYEGLFPFKIDLKATAEIKWNFVDETGTKISSADVQLCPVKSTEKETLDTCNYYEKRNPDGSFSFTGLREGKFVLVVSEHDFPEFDSPYLKYYFPGVKTFSEAQIINLEQGQELVLPNFKLPMKMPTRQITGKLFWENGKPVTAEDLDEDGVYFKFYNPQRDSLSLSMSHFISPSESTDDGLKFNNDGTFSFHLFERVNYKISISADTKSQKKYSKTFELKAEDNLKPLEIILEKVKNK